MSNRAFQYDYNRYPNWIDPKETTPYPRNAKLHPPEQVQSLINSITKFGWQQDCVLTEDNVLVIGHGRRLAAIEIGCMLPYHRVGKNADELTEEDINALRLVDNKTNESAWDWKAMEAELSDLEIHLDMTQFGFDSSKETDVDSLFTEQPQEDAEEEEPKQIQCPHCGQWFTP